MRVEYLHVLILVGNISISHKNIQIWTYLFKYLRFLAFWKQYMYFSDVFIDIYSRCLCALEYLPVLVIVSNISITHKIIQFWTHLYTYLRFLAFWQQYMYFSLIVIVGVCVRWGTYLCSF